MSKDSEATKTEMLAVHKLRLREFLERLGLWDRLISGKVKCSVCGSRISVDNLGFIIPSHRRVLLCCSNSQCIFKIRTLIDKGGQAKK